MSKSSEKHDLRDFRVDSTIAVGDKVRVILRSNTSEYGVCVLDLREVAGYFDKTQEADSLKCVRIDTPGGSYCTDLSLRLRRKEVKEYPEAFIFKVGKFPNIVFRAVAKDIQFKVFENDAQSIRDANNLL